MNIILIISISCILSIQMVSAEVIHLPKSALNTETKTMNFLIDNYFDEKDAENPRVRRKIEENIKRLNPHITNWNYLQDETRIYYEKKSPRFDISLNGGMSSYTDDTIESKNNYFGISGKMDYYVRFKYLLFLNLRLDKSSHTANDPSYTYEGSSTLGYELGMTRIFSNPWWQGSVSLEKERIATLSALLASPGGNYSNDELHRDIIKRSTLSFMWLKLGLEYQFNFLKTRKEGAVFGIYGFSLDGHLTTREDPVVTETITAHKIDFGYRQYLYQNWWGKFNYCQYFLYSSRKINHSLFQISVGINL